jgi:hypothetical protein
MKTVFDGLIIDRIMWGCISKLEDMKIESLKTEKQRENGRKQQAEYLRNVG